MFGDAVRDGLIVTNPFAGLRLETPRGRKDLTALAELEIRELADMAAARTRPESCRRRSAARHSDGGRLVMQLYGHPDEDRARDRLKMAFATDAGSEREAPLRRMGSKGVAGRSPK
jgi:hypothetical protein